MKKGFLFLGFGLLVPLSAMADDVSRFFRNYYVYEGETIQGDMTVMRGDLIVEGTIEGDVVVMFGDCKLRESGRISGDLAVLHGQLDLFDPEQVGGRISQRDFLKGLAEESEESPFRVEQMTIEEDEGKAGHQSETVYSWSSQDDEDLRLRFNRVAGLQLGLSFEPSMGHLAEKELDLSGNAVWAFGTKRPEFSLDLRKALTTTPLFYASVGGQRNTDTQDAWMLSTLENSLAGWLLKQDYLDYVDRDGLRAGLGLFLAPRHTMNRSLHLTAQWFSETWSPEEVNTQWNWSSVDRPYRPNLYSEDLGFRETKADGIRLGAQARWLANGRDDHRRKGLQLDLQYESSLNGSIDSGTADSDPEIEFTRTLADLRFWMPFGRKHREAFSLRALFGANTGDAPAHYGFRLGGPDALPGYRFKSLDATQSGLGLDSSSSGYGWKVQNDPYSGAKNLFLLSGEYRLSGRSIPFPVLEDLLEDFSYLLLADAGRVFNEDWSDLKAEDLQADVGLGIAGDDDDWRLALFRSTESSEADWRLLFRINRRF